MRVQSRLEAAGGENKSIMASLGNLKFDLEKQRDENCALRKQIENQNIYDREIAAHTFTKSELKSWKFNSSERLSQLQQQLADATKHLMKTRKELARVQSRLDVADGENKSILESLDCMRSAVEALATETRHQLKGGDGKRQSASRQVGHETRARRRRTRRTRCAARKILQRAAGKD